MSWGMVIWRRSQQMFGAIVATGGVTLFLYCIVVGRLPGDLAHDLPNPSEGTAYQISAHDPRIDDGEVKQAVGLCRGTHVDAARQTDSAGKTVGYIPLRADTLPASLIAWSQVSLDPDISSFELSAIADSARISADRLKFEEGAREKQDRIRRYQVSVLLLTAAASFLIGVKTLLSNNDANVSFPFIMQGAWLPISVAALLVPVVATVYSGIIAFDDDARVALRYARALAQLEQLHGRIVADVAGDPLLCGLRKLDPNTYVDKADASGGDPKGADPRGADPKVADPKVADSHGTSGSAAAASPPAGKVPLKAIPANAYACLLLHEDKVKAWGQRYEQIMNDASQTLAQAGDLAKGDSRTIAPLYAKPKHVQATEDPCADAFKEQEDALAHPGGDQHAASEAQRPVVAAVVTATPKRP